MNSSAVLSAMATDRHDRNTEPDPIPCESCKTKEVEWFWNPGRSSKPGSYQFFKPCWMNSRTCEDCRQKEREKSTTGDDPIARLKRSGIPDRYSSITAGNPCYQKDREDWNEFRKRIPNGLLGIPLDSREDYQTAINWHPSKGWLLIEGRPGTGKTAVACAVVADILLQPCGIGRTISAIYESESGIYDAIRQSRHLESDQRNIAKEARTASVLIIDDLGSCNDSPGWCKDVLQSIIMHRYDKRLATVCTTNLSLEMLEKHYGERTLSRILDSVGQNHLRFDNPTWRSTPTKTVSQRQRIKQLI